MAERSVNKAILVGRLGGDAETRYTQGGTPVSRFSLAMNRQWRDSEKQVHEETDWLYVVLWRNENLAAYLTKGAKLYVEGRIQTRSYDDNEGVKRYVTEVVADNIVLLGGNGNASVNGANRERNREAVESRASQQTVAAIASSLRNSRVFKTMTCLSKKGFPAGPRE